MTLHIYCQNPNSEGAGELATALGVRRIAHTNSRYRGGPGKRIINWGSGSRLPEATDGSTIINAPGAVAVSSNKLRFFQLMDDGDARTPEWTENAVTAVNWGCPVVCRTVLNGHSGAGIVLFNPQAGVGIINAPLYTQYVKKSAEFRVHIHGGAIIDVQAKKKRLDFDGDVNWQVRNHDNGFVYCRNEIEVPEDVKVQALLAFEETNLDFGAVDVIWNSREQSAYVLEVNTAPGLAGETVQIYARTFREYL